MRLPLLLLILLSLVSPLYAQEASPTHAVGADFNGDGQGDVAVASSNGRVFLLLGQPNGSGLQTPQTHLVSGQPHDLIVADFTGDGLPDLLCNTGNRLVLLPGDKAKGLSEALALPTTFRQIVSATVGDFNGDDIDDIAVANWGPDLTVLLGRGDGTFLKPIVGRLPLDPFSVAAIDLDEDGTDEIAVSLVGNRKVVWARTTDGLLDLTGRLAFTGPIGYLTAGDFDGDGRDDLGAVGNDKFYLLTRKRGKLAEPTVHSAGHEALLQFVTAADLNGDGRDELLSTDLTSGRVVVPSGKPIDDGVYAWRAGAFDLDGDGKAEILIANVRHGTITIIESALDHPLKTIYSVDPNKPDG